MIEANIFLRYEDIKQALKQFLDKFTQDKEIHIVPIPKASDFWKPILNDYDNQEAKEVLLFDIIFDTGKTIQKYKKLYPKATVLTILTKQPDPTRYHLFTIPKSLHNKWFYGCGLDLIKYDGIRMLSDLPYIAYLDPKDEAFMLRLSQMSRIPAHKLLELVSTEKMKHS